MAASLKRDDLLADPGLQGSAFCRAYTDRVDRWLRQLYVTATGAPDRVALVAVGGFGRREMCPASDIDLWLVHDRRTDVSELAEKLWYPIWDSGVKLGHGVFTKQQGLKLAVDEVDTATALLDGRHVAGDVTITSSLLDAARGQWQAGPRHWLPKLSQSLRVREVNSGEVAFLLEPDLKNGRGGLRDAHALRWLEAYKPGLEPADRTVLADAHERLLEARVALHRLTGRSGDVLRLQDQDGVAELLGCEDADALMGRIAAAARTIDWLTGEAFDRAMSASARKPRRLRPRKLGGGMVELDGRLHLEEAVRPGVEGCIQLVDMARLAAVNEMRITRDTLESFVDAEVTFPDPWPVEVRERFVELLRSGPPMVPVVETLDHFDLWSRVIPEWAPVRSKPQRNAYHRFTVDRHLCEAVVNAAALTGRVDRPDLLVIGALLHDIGKGYPERDHTEIGLELVETIAARMGFGPEDTETLVDLVRYHLLLPDVATRRDLQDEATIGLVAQALRTPARLRILHALTEADAGATGPAAWGDWKAGLVRELVARTETYLGEPGHGSSASAFPSAEQLAQMAKRIRRVHGEGTTFTVIDSNRPGMFARVAGVLALNGLDVLGAVAVTDPSGMAINEFSVASQHNGDVSAPINWAKVHQDCEAALAGRLAVRARLAERARVYHRRRAASAAWAPFDNKVVFDIDASESATVVEVRAQDAVGLLYRITATIAELDLDIQTARVQTLGDHVVDAFYLRDSFGQKIVDPNHLAEIERALKHALD